MDVYQGAVLGSQLSVEFGGIAMVLSTQDESHVVELKPGCEVRDRRRKQTVRRHDRRTRVAEVAERRAQGAVRKNGGPRAVRRSHTKHAEVARHFMKADRLVARAM